MKMEELGLLITISLNTTIGNILGFDGVSLEITKRCVSDLIAMLESVEIEDRCPVCDCHTPDDLDGEALTEAVIASMKRTVDTRLTRDGVGPKESQIVYQILGELSRNTAMAMMGYLMELRSKQ